MKHCILLLFIISILVGCAANESENLNEEPLVISKKAELDKYWIGTQEFISYKSPVPRPIEPGAVKVKYLINSNGEVINPIVISPKSDWDETALGVAKNSQYTNSERNASKTPVYFVAEFKFSGSDRTDKESLQTEEEIYKKFVGLNLVELGESDIAARSGNFGEMDWEVVSREDAVRRKRVREILATDSNFSAKEYLLAALIMQHGSESEDYRQAMNLAKKAVEVDPNHIMGRSLSCTAEDRYLLSIGNPQVWGTQLITKQNSDNSYQVLHLDNFDKQARSDIDRQNLCGLPSLKTIEQKLKVMKTLPTIDEQFEHWGA